MVKSEQIYTPQTYCQKLTGYCYLFAQYNTVKEIEAILRLHDLEYWNYPLSEIDHIVENELNVVLVDVSGHDEYNVWKTEHRWFEVPDDFTEEDE